MWICSILLSFLYYVCSCLSFTAGTCLSLDAMNINKLSKIFMYFIFHAFFWNYMFFIFPTAIFHCFILFVATFSMQWQWHDLTKSHVQYEQEGFAESRVTFSSSKIQCSQFSNCKGWETLIHLTNTDQRAQETYIFGNTLNVTPNIPMQFAANFKNSFRAKKKKCTPLIDTS